MLSGWVGRGRMIDLMGEGVERSLVDLERASSESWDVVVIGAGMGGGAAVHRLVAAGLRVLLVERGRARFFGDVVGVETEHEDPEDRLASGKWPTKIDATIDGVASRFWAPLGCGLGGSTLLYAAALQRLAPEDFETTRLPDGRTVGWPIAYSELEPYYSEAERLLSVCGSRDPLSSDPDDVLLSPPAMSDVDRHLFERFEAAGLNPFRLHVGVRYDPGCGECGGQVCITDCKRDARNAFILPASGRGDLAILEGTEVLRLRTSGPRVSAVELRSEGREALVTASVVILAGGAYFSPMLLLRSRSEDWPEGLANRSGMVGRNLMFHASDFVAVWPRGRHASDGPRKTIALRDFYRHHELRLGEIQSTGLSAGYGNILFALRSMFDLTSFAKLPLVRRSLIAPAWVASRFLGDATVFATIVEDFPYPHNRVVEDPSTPSGMRFEYRIDDDLRSRVDVLRRSFRGSLGGLRTLPLSLGVNLNFGHPCGTCRAGEDPADSVVGADGRAHWLENLFVVDASYMPTSGGTNPSLTIAANAMRIADRVRDLL